MVLLNRRARRTQRRENTGIKATGQLVCGRSYEFDPIPARNLRVLCALLFSLALIPAHATEPVRASIGKETAWTGEAVPLTVTLYSPGPFSGTATFDLPELPRTVILKVGSPVVGSEEVDGESLFTQRHEFRVYTQQTGQFVVPSFPVRFQGKKSFVAQPEPMQGRTTDLEFESKRPPGTEKLGMVIASSTLECEQSWNPADQVDVSAGDVIERTITRRVAGTTAMMLRPADTRAPDGVRVYTSDPIVEDKVTRGQLNATRVDTMKYQFQRPGNYELPDVTFAWWDPDAAELRRTTLEGQVVDVAALPLTNEEPIAKSGAVENPYAVWALWALVPVAMALLLCKPVGRLVAKWRAIWNSPEAVAAREVGSACKANDARRAYAAILNWSQIVAATSAGDQLGEPWDRLTAHLFSGDREVDHWSGEPLRNAFVIARKRRIQVHDHPDAPSLPALNP